MPRKGQTVVEFNEKYFEQIMKSAGVQAACKAKAEAALKIAQDNAPYDTGDYHDRLKVKKVSHQHRDTYLVVGEDAKTLLIESKTGNLARALKAVKKA